MVFGNRTVETFQLARRPTYLLGTATWKDALKTLVDARVLSAPVYDEKQQRFVGFLDMFDLVSILIDNLHSADLQASQLQHVVSDPENFANKPIQESVDVSIRNPFISVQHGTLLQDVLDIFVGDKKEVRRVGVLDASKSGADQLVSIVSQNNLIQYLAFHQELTTHLKDKTVDSLFPCREVVSITGSSTVLTAFKTMREHAISGLAIVDDHHSLIGSLSIRDLKGLLAEDGNGLELARLLAPVRQYIQYITSLLVDDRHPAVSVTPADTFQKLILVFAGVRVHRLFVVDHANLPISVISCVDVLRLLHSQKS